MASIPHPSQKRIPNKKKKLFSGSAVIKLFLKNVNCSRNYLFEMLKLKEFKPLITKHILIIEHFLTFFLFLDEIQ
jgi:hypothetical protein